MKLKFLFKPSILFRRLPHKTVLVMKLTFFFLFIACMQVSATGYSQKVTLSVKNTQLKQVFGIIEKQTGYNFYYKTELIKNSKNVTIDLNQAPLENALNEIFKDEPLNYFIVENNIILSQKQAQEEKVLAPQLLRVTGTVIDDEDGTVLFGASVVVKGTRTGTSTDKLGYFVLENIPEDAVLVITFTGYQQREIHVSQSQNITISLKKTEKKISEVVVNTGLYSRPKESFTGAATTVTGDQLREVNGLNVLQALKVFDASVHIQDNVQFGSDPNKLPDLTLRGTNNFPVQGTSGNIPVSGADFSATYMQNPNQPLFILDGFEVSIQKVYDLDMNRIASFTILKDATATAIYGSRAANGVIVIETVQPNPGKLQLSYSAQVQITAPDLTVYNLANAAEKLEVERLAGKYTQFSTDIRADLDAFYKQWYSSRLAKVQEGVNTYWLSQPVRTGVGQRHSLHLEGGDNYVRYGINFGYNNLAGVMKNSNRNNYSGDMNISYRYKKLLVKNVLNVEINKANNSNYGSFGDYARMNPYWAPFDENGNPVQVLEKQTDPTNNVTYTYLNPLYNTTLHTVNKSNYTNLLNQTYLEWKLNNNVKLTGKLGLTRQIDQSDAFLPGQANEFFYETDFSKKGSYYQDHSQFFSYDGSLQMDLNKRWNKGVLYNTTGVSMAESNSDYTSIYVVGFPNQRMDQIEFGNGYPPNSKPGGGNSITRRISAFSNFNYTYNNRYLADFSISADGSSQFGTNKRFAPFWSAGLGWNVHKEALLAHSKNINQLRLRASIGSTGDNKFPPFMGITSYQYYTSRNYRSQVGAVLLGYGNKDLQWQQTLKRNIGADMTLFNSRLSLSVNYYIENTKGLILDINTPPSDGITSYKENVGELENKGYEFNATYFILKNQTKQTYWSVFVNGNHNKNYIKKISNALKKLNDKNNTNDQTVPQLRFEEGQSVNSIWAVRSAGIDPANGREVFYKKDGTITYNWSANDKIIAGVSTPDMNGNFGSNFTFKGITLGIYFDFRVGGQIYNQTLQSRVEGANLDYQVDKRVLLGRWAKPGDVTYFQRLLYSNGNVVIPPTYVTTRFIEKNNYLNANSISLSYEIPEKVINKWSMANTRITFIGNDIKRWSSVQVERGLDYPFARNFTINISTSFK